VPRANSIPDCRWKKKKDHWLRGGDQEETGSGRREVDQIYGWGKGGTRGRDACQKLSVETRTESHSEGKKKSGGK